MNYRVTDKGEDRMRTGGMISQIMYGPGSKIMIDHRLSVGR